MAIPSGVHNHSYKAQVRLAGRQAEPPLVYSTSDRVRFAAKVREDESGCWLWTASVFRSGYGQFAVQVARRTSKHLQAHRVAWEMANGPIPGDLCICHQCDRPLCVRPDHLFLGTRFDNMRDASVKGHMSRPRKRNRGRKDEAIQRYLDGAATQRQLAVEYGVTHITMCRWLKGLHEPYQRPRPPIIPTQEVGPP